MKTCNLGFIPERLPDVLAILGKHIGSFAGGSGPLAGDPCHLADIILSPSAPSETDRQWIEAVYRAYAPTEPYGLGWAVLTTLEAQHLVMCSYGGVTIDISVEDYGRGQVVDLSIDFGRDSMSLAGDLLSDFEKLPGMYYDQGLLGEQARYHMDAARHYASLSLVGQDEPEAVSSYLAALTW